MPTTMKKQPKQKIIPEIETGNVAGELGFSSTPASLWNRMQANFFLNDVSKHMTPESLEEVYNRARHLWYEEAPTGYANPMDIPISAYLYLLHKKMDILEFLFEIIRSGRRDTNWSVSIACKIIDNIEVRDLEEPSKDELLNWEITCLRQLRNNPIEDALSWDSKKVYRLLKLCQKLEGDKFKLKNILNRISREARQDDTVDIDIMPAP